MNFPAIKVPESDVKALEDAREAVLDELDKPADRSANLGNATAQFARVKAKIADASRAAIGSVLTSFMVAHPTVESLRWEHCSDEWNDEEYYFCIHEPAVRLAGAGEDYLGYYDLKGGKYADEATEKSIREDLAKLHKFFEDHEDFMRATFGGDSVVTVGRDGAAKVEGLERD